MQGFISQWLAHQISESEEPGSNLGSGGIDLIDLFCCHSGFGLAYVDGCCGTWRIRWPFGLWLQIAMAS